MLEESKLQTFSTDATATDASTVDAPTAPSTAPVTAPIPSTPSRLPLGFPCTLKDVAEHLDISYDTLRNKWIGRIEAIYDGLESPTIRDSSRKVTPFGFAAIEDYVTAIDRNGISYETYRATVRERYPVQQAAPIAPEAHSLTYQPQQDEMERFSPPAQKIFKFTSTTEFVEAAKQNAETALDVTQGNSTSLVNALINQMQQEGQKLGLTLFQAKYGTAHSVLAELEQTLAKKSGLVEDTQPPPVG